MFHPTLGSSSFVARLLRRRTLETHLAHLDRLGNAEKHQIIKTFRKVESVQIHKDRKGESKGIAYVKFSKTSEAALAVEEMNGRCIGHHPRPLKVILRQKLQI